MVNELALAWGGIIALGIILYVILDGFDLGIGIISIFFRATHHRDLAISTIIPVWDGNETWLVFGGAALYGAFPLAFSTIFPAIYGPALAMVLALLLRGVSFEFHLKAVKTKRFWDWLFFLGSLIATIAQGLILGEFVKGFTLKDGIGSGLTYDWINPFGMTCAVALIFGYVLLGSNWLIAKTTGEMQNICFKISNAAQYIIVFFAVVVSVWSPFLDPAIKQRWFNPENMLYLAILPLITAGLAFLHWRALKQRREFAPFWLSVGIFVCCYIGFIISCYPYIVPRHITYLEAAAPRSSLLFMLVGACIMLPILLYYTYYSYKIFRGKVTEKIEY